MNVVANAPGDIVTWWQAGVWFRVVGGIINDGIYCMELAVCQFHQVSLAASWAGTC